MVFVAKIGGRSAWLAWPAGLVCLGVVLTLVVMAAPGVPAAVDFVGSTLRGGTAARAAEAAEAERRERIGEAATDCRSLYPDRLWAELTWTPEVLLSQNGDAPAVDESLLAALTPAVRFTCAWRLEDGRSIRSTVSTVPDGGASIAQAALSAVGFGCSVEGERVHCERSADGVTEVHDLQGETWLATVMDRWTSDDYAADTYARAFAP